MNAILQTIQMYTGIFSHLIPYLSGHNWLLMALINAELTHPDFGFTIIDADNHSVFIDIPITQGGGGAGVRPMQTLLAALCGCSGVDIVHILKKQREPFTSLKIFADGEREQNKEPSLWQAVHVRFELTGEIDSSKAYRAANLSINKYCSVAETLRRSGTTITFDVFVNGTITTN
jgi:putative redox protein